MEKTINNLYNLLSNSVNSLFESLVKSTCGLALFPYLTITPHPPYGSAWNLASPPQLGLRPHRTPSTVRPMAPTLLLQHYHLTPPSSTTSPYVGIFCLSYLFLVRSQKLHIISPPTILPYFENGLYLGVSEIQNNNISLHNIT